MLYLAVFLGAIALIVVGMLRGAKSPEVHLETLKNNHFHHIGRE